MMKMGEDTHAMKTAKSLFCPPATLLGESQNENPMNRPPTTLRRILAIRSVVEAVSLEASSRQGGEHTSWIAPVVLEGTDGDELELSRGVGGKVASRVGGGVGSGLAVAILLLKIREWQQEEEGTTATS